MYFNLVINKGEPYLFCFIIFFPRKTIYRMLVENMFNFTTLYNLKILKICSNSVNKYVFKVILIWLIIRVSPIFFFKYF